MSKVAIVGSCITRDVWRFRGAAADDLLYISRTSLPALMSAPVAGFVPAASPPADLRPAPHRAVVADLAKTALPALLAFRPSHIVFDFIDERFDLLSVGGAIATRSAELVRSGYLGQPAFDGARRIPRLSTGAERLWDEAAGAFAALVRTTALADARLILHSARWAGVSKGAGGRPQALDDVEILAGEPADIAAHNRLLARSESAFEALMPPMARVEAPARRIADRGHQWGLSPFHYVEDYYADIARQLTALGVALAAA